MTTLALFQDTSRSAVISPCGRYRYRLDRVWDPAGCIACWIMLNPSKADGEIDDPTVVRITRFSQDFGCGGLIGVNMFAWRATDPRELSSATDPVGPDADRHIMDALAESSLVVCAWGGSGPKGLAPGRAWEILRMIERSGHVPMALAKTKAGAPRHPLYLKRDLRPRPLAELE